MKRSAPRRSVGLKPSAIPLVRTPLKKATVSRKRQKLGAITHGQRIRIYERDDYTCVYCESPVGHGHRRATLDHVTAVSQGGDNSDSNLVTACWSCNMDKQSTNANEWLGKKRGLDNSPNQVDHAGGGI
jgi:5-methylcytosine-specific restriction endonuclease McrA